MKFWKKLTIIVGILVVVGVAAALIYEEVYNESRGYQNYVSSSKADKSAIIPAPVTQPASPVTQQASPFLDVDGKVTDLTADKITVNVPLQGSKTFKIDANTRIEDFLQPLKKDSLVEIDVNGDLAYNIETDRTMEAYGTIVAITDQEVTIYYNGTEQSFKKTANFRIESDGYIGPIEGLPAEIYLNENFEIVGLEVDDDGYDD